MWLSLLPGVRHLRAPLAAGYLWLAVVWLAVHDRLDEPGERGPAFDAVFDLRDTVSMAGLAVGVSFVAYVIGSLSQPVTTSLVQAAGVRLGAPRGRLSFRGEEHLNLLARRMIREVNRVLGEVDGPIWIGSEVGYSRRGWTEPPGEVIQQRVVDALLEDLPLVHRRLAGVEETRELFADIDRTQSEAELRLAVWLPLAAAIVAFGTAEWGWLGLVASAAAAVPIAFGLAVQGMMRLAAANDALVDVVRSRTAQFPTVERLTEALSAEHAEREKERRESARSTSG